MPVSRPSSGMRFEWSLRDAAGVGLVAGVLLFSTACYPSASSGDAEDEVVEDAFGFALRQVRPLELRVSSEGEAVRGVTVQLLRPLELDAEGVATRTGGPFYAGATNAEGLCTATVSLPVTLEEVDVVLHHPAYEGAHHDEQVRVAWGPFAPSAWIRSDVSTLDELVVEMEGRQ